jgi:uncharacterized protein (TIGR03437 family)
MSQTRFLKVLLAILALVICTGTLQATATLVVSPTTLALTCDTIAGPAPGTVAVTLVAAGSESVVASSSSANVIITSAATQTVASTSVPVNFIFSAKASCAGATVGTTTGITLTFTPTPGTVITVAATLTVTNSGSALMPSTTAVTLTCNKTTGAGSAQVVNVYSSANLGTPFTVSNSSANSDALPGWLTVTPTAGGTASGTPVALTFTAVSGSTGSDCGTLPAGSTTFSSVHLTSTGSVAADKLISVTVQVEATATLTATPTSVALTYVTGTTSYNTATPSVSSSPAVFFQVNAATVPIWLNVTPTSSNTSPQILTFAVTAGAQTLAVGSYSANIHLAVSNELDTVIPVTLQVNNPSASMSIVGTQAPSINWTIGNPLPTLLITPISSDSPISYTVSTTAGTLSPQVSSQQGLAYSFGSPLEVTFLQSVFGGAAPGVALTGHVIITPVGSGVTACGSTSCDVTITVHVQSPGSVITSVLPASLPIGAAGAQYTVVLSGSGFVSGGTAVGIVPTGSSLMVADSNVQITSIQSSSIDLTITVPSVPDPYLPFSGTGGTVTLAVCNYTSPATSCSTPTSANGAGANGTYQITIGVNPIIQAVTSASSYIEATSPALPTVAPYDILSIFGTNFCVSGGSGCISPNPTVMYGATNTTTFAYPATLSPDPTGAGQRNLTVTFYPHGNTATPIASAPLLFATNNQINLLAPDALKNKIGSVVDMYVSFGYNSGATLLKSAAYPMAVTATDPGVFTVGGDGQGDAAALMSQSYALITSTTPAIARATQGNSDTVLLYVSGLGEPDGSGTTFTYTCMTSAAYWAAVQAATSASPALTSDDGLVIQPAYVTSGDLEPCLASGNTDLPTVTIGGVNAPVTFAGWVEGAVAGLYQINVQLPSATSAGLTYAPGTATTVATAPSPLPVVVKANGLYSQLSGVNLYVQQGLLATVTGATSGPTSSNVSSNPVYTVTAAHGVTLPTDSSALTVVGAQGAASGASYGFANSVITGTVNGLTLSALPSDLTLDPAAGTIEGTIGSDMVGTTNVEITVTDSTSGLTGNVIISFVIS